MGEFTLQIAESLLRISICERASLLLAAAAFWSSTVQTADCGADAPGAF